MLYKKGQKVAIVKVMGLEPKCVYSGYWVVDVRSDEIQVIKLSGYSKRNVSTAFNICGVADGKNEDNYHYLLPEK